ncbi:MAG: chemotaxis protein CheC [Chthonomonas sp.]|nr:chemotaxis protein CheC [Chthonomonas sp.]
MGFEISMNTVQLSAVHEICNIGLGHALTALSTMTGRSFNMEIPKVDAVPAATISQMLGGPDEIVVSVLMPFEGDVDGQMAFLFPWESAQQLWAMLLGAAPADYAAVDDMHMSATREVGNIINSSFLNALADMTGLRMHATPPSFALDMAISVAGSIVVEAEAREAVALAVETAIFDSEHTTKGYFVLIPTVATLRTMFERLGIAEAA